MVHELCALPNLALPHCHTLLYYH